MSVEWNNLNQIGRAEMTGYEAGKRDEQERIIKLLEDPATLQVWFTRSENYQTSNLLRYVADLIKGENK